MTNPIQSLTIDTGEIRLLVNNDPSRVISFNPRDVLFAERLYNLIGELKDKQVELQAKQIELDKVTATDENGLPMNAGAILAMQREVNDYMRDKIDGIFGPGTCQTAFGDVSIVIPISDTLPCAAEQFLTGVTPYIQTARSEKVKQYLAPAPRKIGKK